METFKQPRDMSARVTSGPHWIRVLRVRTTAEDSGESYGGGVVTFRSAEGGAWVARACSQRRKTRRVDGRLVPALLGVAVARRGAPDPVVAGENWGGRRRRTCSQQRRSAAWTGGWFRHRWGWLSLREALQIQWSPAKTEVAGDSGE